MDAEQRALVRFIREYTSVHGYPPNRREMAEHLNRSPSTTQMILEQMIHDGVVTAGTRVARSVVITGAAMKQLEQGAL